MPVRQWPAWMPGIQLPSGETEVEFKSPSQVLNCTRALLSVHFCPQCPVHGGSVGRDRVIWVGSGELSPALSLHGVPRAGAWSVDEELPPGEAAALPCDLGLQDPRPWSSEGGPRASRRVVAAVTLSSGTRRPSLKAGPSTWAFPLHSPRLRAGTRRVPAQKDGALLV